MVVVLANSTMWWGKFSVLPAWLYIADISKSLFSPSEILFSLSWCQEEICLTMLIRLALKLISKIMHIMAFASSTTIHHTTIICFLLMRMNKNENYHAFRYVYQQNSTTLRTSCGSARKCQQFRYSETRIIPAIL